jgi:hypothetical protein
LIAAFILFVLFAFARVVFSVHIQGSLAGFLGICAAFSLMTPTFGLMIAALGETVEATRGYFHPGDAPHGDAGRSLGADFPLPDVASESDRDNSNPVGDRWP